MTDLSPAFSAQLAEVSVDEDTGEVTLHRLVIVQDVGRALNPAAIGGQMMGGAVQGIGWALHEDLAYDDGGQLIAGSWMDYSVPDVLQVAPDLDVVIIEVPSEHGVLGIRGVGEAPVVPTPAAIANAIADASGARMTQLPITAPSLRAALNQWRQRPQRGQLASAQLHTSTDRVATRPPGGLGIEKFRGMILG